MPQSERVLPPVQEVGFRGLHASTAVPVPVGFVSLAENLYLQGKVWKVRPGLAQAGSVLSDGNPVQMIAHFEEMDGTLHTIALCNADLYSYNWSTDSWSVTDLASESITVDSSAKCDWVISRGRIVITDGVNKPFMWNPLTDVYTTLSAAPIAAGCEIYYDRVFFFDLPGSDANVFEWSNPTDPTTGYNAENLSWEFAQSDTGAVRNLIGLNEIMPVMKDDSIALLRGAAEEAFQTDAVREGVSETEGCPGKFISPVIDGDVYYLSINGPRMLSRGMKRVPLDLDADSVNILEPIWDTFSTSEIQNGISFHDKKRRHVVFLLSKTGETTKYEGLLYSHESGSWSKIAFDDGFDWTCASSVENDDGEELVMLGDADGNVYIYGDNANTDDAGTDFTYRLRSRQYGQSIGIVQKRLVQVDLILNILDNPFSAETLPYINGKGASEFPGRARNFGYETTGKQRYRRGFNDVGYTVGWELTGSAQKGKCEIHEAMTQITTSSQTWSRG